MTNNNTRTVLARIVGEKEFREVRLISSKRFGNLYRKIVLRGLSSPRLTEKFTLNYAQNRAFEFRKPAIARCGEKQIIICRIDSYEYH